MHGFAPTRIEQTERGQPRLKAALRRCGLLASALLALALPAAAQTSGPTYTIGAVTPSSIAAGANGATLALTGTLPDFTQGVYQVCFYTGAGSTAALTPMLTGNALTVAVPASTIQSIPSASFTAANGYAVAGLVSVVAAGTVCDGTYSAALTNQVTVPVVEPVLTAYAGPVSIPKTNPSITAIAPPTAITLTGANFTAGTTVTFGSFGTITPKVLSATSLSVPVPAAFAASAAGTTATLNVCNSGGGTSTFCSTASPAVTLTVTALAASAGAITASPNPVTTSGQTVLTAQFAKSGTAAGTGAPSGAVTFVADGTTLAPAALTLDRTATFATQTTTVTTPAAATPVITPSAGTYLNSTMVSIADTTPGAAIYYTQDGSTPTTASTLYTAPFQIVTSQTVTAIAAAAGVLNSAAASSAYTITVTPPTQLVFTVQPVNTSISTAIAPSVRVAIEDANGNIVTSSTAAVTLALGSNPGQSTLGGTVTGNAVNGVATFANLTLNNVGTGYTLMATSGQLTPATSAAFNITPYPITMTVQSALVGIASTLNGSFTLGHAAPTGGVVVTLTSSTPANATISPATVTVPAGQTMGSFTYTGVAAGSSTLSASATNYQTGTVVVTGTAAQVSLGTIPAVAPGQMVSLALSLAMPAPAGGTTVTFTSSNTNVATVTSTIFVPAGQRTAATNPQINGITIGTTTITATAPGYAPDTRAVNVTVVASINPGYTSINLATTTSTTLNLSAPAQTGGLTFTLTSDDPTVATVPSSVTVVQGSTSVQVPITGVADGTTTIRADYPGVVEATSTVNVNSKISESDLITGYTMENAIGLYLPVTPQAPVTVTVTTNGPGVASISKSATVAGTTTLTFTNVISNYVGTIYVQGQTIGATTMTVSAPGFTTGTSKLSVYPVGFSFYPYSGDFSTTTFSTPTTLTVSPVLLDPTTLNIYTYGLNFNPGITPVNVGLTSATTSIGTITTSPLVFQPNQSYQQTTFQPAGVGTSTVTIGNPPAGYSVPAQSQYQQLKATVSAPQITVNDGYTGVNLQNSFALYLPVAPPSPVTVTVTSNGPSLLTLSKDGTSAGSTTLTFTNVSTQYVGTVYVQGLNAGKPTITVSATGYTSGTGTITVYSTGFSFYPYSGDFSTTTFSAPTTLTLSTVLLDPQTLNIVTYGLALSPGAAAASVPLTNTTSAVGTLTSSAVVFHAGENFEQVNFAPAGAGTSTVTIGTPTAPYSVPAQTQYQHLTATVTAPQLSISGTTTGINLQSTIGVYVPVSPPNPVTVTVTSSGPSIATISKDGTVVGGTTLTFPNISAAGGLPTIYVQGQSAGTTMITVSAPGFTSASSAVTVGASGFSFYAASGDFTTTTFSSPNAIGVFTVVLDPQTLNIITYGQPLSPGVSAASVPITNSATSVGTISPSPLVFHPGDSYQQTTYTPVSAGTSVIAIGATSGFSTPSQTQYQQLMATVTAPAISVNSIETGVNLQNGISVYLPVAPPNPVTVTVTSNGPAIATISSDGTVVGGTTLTFPNVTAGGSLPTIYVQGQAVGSTTITATAAGYTNGSGTVTVYPSGFSFYGGTGDFTTTASSNPTTITFVTALLNLGTLTIRNYNLALSPGLGTVSVPVVSGNTSVGTITTSPVTVGTGLYYGQTTFQPGATGSTPITLGTPAGFSTPTQYTQITATVQ